MTAASSNGALGNLPDAVGDDDGMGAGNLLGMEPQIIIGGFPQSQLVVLEIVSAGEDQKPSEERYRRGASFTGFRLVWL